MLKKAIYYSVVAKVNPKDPQGSRIYYAQVQSRGTVTLDTIARRIQQTCTVTRADILGALAALEQNICESLANGEITRLSELGSLQMIIRSKGAKTEKEYSTDLISRVYPLFRPGQGLQDMLTTLTYVQVEPKTTQATDDEQA